MEIPRVRIEDAHLLRRGAHHRRMRVPDMRHVVVGVEIAAPGRVEQELLPAAHDLERRSVTDAEVRADARPALGDGAIDVERLLRIRGFRPVQQDAGIR